MTLATDVSVANGAMEAINTYIKVGDLSKLSADQRVSLYNGICESLGLNPLTRPFDFISLQGKLTLYARKDCTDQLRRIHHLSITEVDVSIEDGLIIARAAIAAPDGRTDFDYGIVAYEGKKGNDYANAYLKAVTKAKRRVTLSICGLGFLDETEIETIPNATPFEESKNHPLAENKKTATEFGQFTLALGSSLFGSEEQYTSHKREIREKAGLASKAVSLFSDKDKEKYVYAIISKWLETIGLESVSRGILMEIYSRFPSILDSNPQDVVEFCLVNLPTEEVNKDE